MHDNAGERAEAYWGAHAQQYNSFIVRVVPRYFEMMERVLDYAPATASRVLELGTGTGNLSLLLAARWPAAQFTFVDGAPEMLTVARARLLAQNAALAERSAFQALRFEELELERNSLDVVVASLSLHHVYDVSAVYRRIAPALAPGGRLVMLDGIAGESDAEHGVHMSRWAAYWKLPGNLTEEEQREVEEHVERHDHYRPLSRHYDLLREAGFAGVDCVWRDGLFALLVAAVGATPPRQPAGGAEYVCPPGGK